MIKYVIFFLVGVFTWTFLEYVIHRFLGHQSKKTNIVKKEHGRHHAELHYFAPLTKKIFLAFIVLSFLTLTIGLISKSWHYGFVYSIGLVCMYMLYEIAHRRFHVAEPIIRHGLKMRKTHFYHHFMNPNKNHGVTSLFWDRIFGTFEKVEKVYIPKSVTLPWLIDENKEVKESYNEVFYLRGKNN